MAYKNSTNSKKVVPNPYNKEFFKRRASWVKDYSAIASWLQKNVTGQTFGDVGCGNAILIEHLAKNGKKVWGIDSASKSDLLAGNSVKDLIKISDITETQKLAASDVTLCFELGERIDKKHADTLVQNLASSNATTIIFTAGAPGEAGVHHINLQPKKYWLEKFAKHDYHLDGALSRKFTRDLKDRLTNATWFLQDIMVFQKCSDSRMIEIMAQSNELIQELAAEIEDLKLVNKKMKHEYWMTAQQLNGILGSTRWKATSKLLRVVRK